MWGSGDGAREVRVQDVKGAAVGLIDVYTVKGTFF